MSDIGKDEKISKYLTNGATNECQKLDEKNIKNEEVLKRMSVRRGIRRTIMRKRIKLIGHT